MCVLPQAMPVGGQVLGSWYHTHAQAKSEMWVLSGRYEALLPQAVIDMCHKTICRQTGQGTNGTTGPMALPLISTGFDIAAVQSHDVGLHHHVGTHLTSKGGGTVTGDGAPPG